MSDLDYAGDLNPLETWSLLKEKNESFLVDCRTAVEWSFVGVPDLQSLKKKVIFLEWQIYPMMQKNENFLEEIKQTEITKDSEIIFLCRSGARSRSAAEFLASYGYRNCYNSVEGFEGVHNKVGQRGVVNGWKFENLPWKQG